MKDQGRNRLLARMAGNIAAGLATLALSREQIASDSVEIARLILDELEQEPEKRDGG